MQAWRRAAVDAPARPMRLNVFNWRLLLFSVGSSALRQRKAELDEDGAFDGANIVVRQACRPGFEPLLVESGDLPGHSDGPQLFRSVLQVVLDGYHGTKP